jgi:DNA primase catalytic core
MSRVPDSRIEEIRNGYPIESYVAELGAKLTRKGAQLVCACVFPDHVEKRASFYVSPAKRAFKCFGCGRSGDIVNLHMQLNHVDFPTAVNDLRARLPSAVANSHSVEPAFEPIEIGEARRTELLTRVADYYFETARDTAEFWTYLKQRGLDSRELVDTFRIGYCNRSLAKKLPDRHGGAGTKIRRELRQLGLLRDSGHESFAGFLFVPLRDENESVVYGYGRRLGDASNGPAHLYLRGERRGFLSPKVFRASDVVLLNESWLDAMTWWVHGYRQVVSTFGADGLTEELSAALLRMRHLVCAQDNDEAGERAANALAHRLLAQKSSIGCWRIVLPGGIKDINEFALKVTPGKKSLGLLLHQMRWMGNGPAPERPLLAGPIEISAAEAPSLRREILGDDFSELNSRMIPLGELAPAEEPEPVSAEDDSAAEPLPVLEIEELAGSRKLESANSGMIDEGLELGAPVIPLLPKVDIPTRMDGQDLWLHLDPVRYRLRGLVASPAHLKNTKSPLQLKKVSLLATRDGSVHASKLDLWDAKDRAAFAKLAAVELSVDEALIRKHLGLVMLKSEEMQDSLAKQAALDKPPEMSPKDEREALELLADENIDQTIIKHMTMCGYVGDDINKLIGYFVVVSRKRDQPLGMVIVASSGSGKTGLLNIILAFVPPEDLKKPSLVTERSLFYFGENDLVGKVLAIAEEEGAEKASYPVKILQSEQELIIFSTKCDPHTGEPTAFEKRVSGPTAVLFTRTATVGNDELLNRCFIVSVDESREQTAAVLVAQREAATIEGLRAKYQREQIRRLHHNAQRLLRPIEVVNPYARQLGFTDHQTVARRGNARYLALIFTIAFLRQKQKPVLTEQICGKLVEFVEVDVKDIEVANRIANHVEGRSLSDLLPHTRQFLLLLHKLVLARMEHEKVSREQVFFTRRDVREETGYQQTQVHEHLHRLLDLEYVLVRFWNGQQYYQLLYNGEGQDGSRFALGLIDPKQLSDPSKGLPSASTVGSTNSDPETSDSEPIRTQFGQDSDGHRTPDFSENESDVTALNEPLVAESSDLGSGGLEAPSPNGRWANGSDDGSEG